MYEDDKDPCHPCVMSGTGCYCEQCSYGYKSKENRTEIFTRDYNSKKYSTMNDRYNFLHNIQNRK